MIEVVTPDNESRYRDQMDQAFRLRHRTFFEEQGWDGPADADACALDEFDDKHAVHMLYVEKGTVFGYQRLLPTTGPHVLSDILPQLCIDEPLVGPHIWELSHQCIDPAHPWGKHATRPIASALGAALVEWGLGCGVTQCVFPIDVAGILPLAQLHFEPVPLGLPCKIRGRDMIAVMVSLNNRALWRLRWLRGSQESVLASPPWPSFHALVKGDSFPSLSLQ